MPPKTKTDKRLYFLALVPGDPIQSELTAFKRTAQKKFRSGHALNSPAHITIIPPFFAMAEQMENFLPALQETLEKFPAFNIRIDGFDHFGNHVIFAAVQPDPLLDDFQNRVYERFKTYFPESAKPNRFHPHLTVAFKDLKPHLFKPAWNYFSQTEYQRHFRPEGLSILFHKDKKWHPWKEIPFPSGF